MHLRPTICSQRVTLSSSSASVWFWSPRTIAKSRFLVLLKQWFMNDYYKINIHVRHIDKNVYKVHRLFTPKNKVQKNEV